MARKLEEVKKDIKELRANTTLSEEERTEKFIALDKELDCILNEILNRRKDIPNKEKSPTPYFFPLKKAHLC